MTSIIILFFQHLRNSALCKNIIMADEENNELLLGKTIAQSAAKSATPRFVSTHLLMPHFPYYYTEQGQLNSMENLGPEHLHDSSLYLGYLKYTNGRLLSVVAQLQKNDPSAVLLLLSDHGYRYSTSGYAYTNLAAVYSNNYVFKKL